MLGIKTLAIKIINQLSPSSGGLIGKAASLQSLSDNCCYILILFDNRRLVQTKEI
jgi:hypothetical protein